MRTNLLVSSLLMLLIKGTMSQVTMLPATPNTRLKKMIKLFQKMGANSALAKSASSVKYDLHQRVNRMQFGQNGFKKTT